MRYFLPAVDQAVTVFSTRSNTSSHGRAITVGTSNHAASCINHWL
ncbi:MAG: hypothetical protein ABI970_06315 [Chloroflexota bacterium]